MKAYFELLAVFIKLGLFTFGGGYAVIPVVERELIKKRGWITMEEVMDYYAVAQVTPGLIAINLSTFVGHKRMGAVGGILATIGFTIPGMVLVSIAAVCLSGFADVPAVKNAFAGIRVAVAALILDTVIKLAKGVFKDWRTLIIYCVVFALSFVWGISSALLVIAAGATGFLAFRKRK